MIQDLDLQNYGYYNDILYNDEWYISTDEIKNNIDNHIVWMINIFRDMIGEPEIDSKMINIEFKNITIKFSIFDYLINIIMWKSVIETRGYIRTSDILFKKQFTTQTIKDFLDKIIIEYRTQIDIRRFNNIIDDTISPLKFLTHIALYLANTINLEDDISLMTSNKEAYDIYHTDVSDIPLQDIKGYTNELTDKLVDIIMDSDHCLADWFLAKQTNRKQYREYGINIGTKPNGEGGIMPMAINSSFIRGGLYDIASLYIESHAGQTAQILGKVNVGPAGYFTRLLEMNSVNTYLHKDPEYCCDTKNLLKLTITNNQFFRLKVGSVYKFHPNDIQSYVLTYKDTHLIGQTLYFYSPITCASHARGEGVCHRCYGILSSINKYTNIGKIATDLQASDLTQRFLSAKHILESKIKKIIWNDEFHEYFEMNDNGIVLIPKPRYNNPDYKIVIDRSSIQLISEEEDVEFNEYVEDFAIELPNGERITMKMNEFDNLYITQELNMAIRKFGIASKNNENEDEILIPFPVLMNENIFFITIDNDELSKLLNNVKSIINKKSITTVLNKDDLMQKYIDSLIDSDLYLMGVHAEVIISNQMRSKEDILEFPDWTIENVDYQILTLKQSLNNNQSIIISLRNDDIESTLYNPLTYRKNKPSFMDLFFMLQPHMYVKGED